MKQNIFVPLLITIIANYSLVCDTSTIELISSKFNNALNFIANASYFASGNWGKISLLNKYEGTAIENISNSFRDNENIFASYSYPIYNNLFLTAECNYGIISDRNININNQLMRLSGIGGIVGSAFNVLSYKLLVGIENNHQASIKSLGTLFKGSVGIKEIDVDNYLIGSNITSDLLYLSDNRSSKDVAIVTSVKKAFSKDEQFKFSIQYKLQERDFMLNNASTPKIETNVNNRIDANLNGNWILADGFVVNIDGNIENINVNRYYNDSYDGINNSLVDRYYNELNLNIKTEVLMKKTKYIPIESKLGVMITNRNERNYLERRYDIDNIALTTMQVQEAQKDNILSTISIIYDGLWLASKYDSIQLKVTISKTEYNTASNVNNDDRDQLNDIVTLSYTKVCSNILSIVHSLNYSQNHLVFIHKERSSQNNWNRIISINSGVKINTKKIIYFPQFEVLANYTIYDFETSLNKPHSYSYRHIAYKDTLFWKLGTNIFFTNRITARLYEQGKLFWTSFSELPQQRNIEISANPMIYYNISKTSKIGIGGKFFNLTYEQISNSPNTTSLTSYSPELSYSIKFSKITLNCYGWLENKFKNNKFDILVPNLYINTCYNL